MAKGICKKCGTDDRYVNGRCRTCHNNHVILNKDRIYARNNLYNKTVYQVNNKETIAAKKRLYRELNKERLDEQGKKRYHKNKERVNARVMARRRGLKSDPETLTATLLIKQMPCGYCGLEGGTVDHILPVSRGGVNHWTNMFPACQKCNDSKGTKTPEEWKNRWYE